MGQNKKIHNKNRREKKKSDTVEWIKKKQNVSLRRGEELTTTTGRHEYGAVIKREKGLINIGLVYPNTYQAGMSNLGFQSVYNLFNNNNNISCHRFFLQDKFHATQLSRYTHLKYKKGANREDASLCMELTSCETGIHLSSCDLIAFSVSFENDYANIVSILKNTGLPPRSFDRTHLHPFIIAGGVACFLNPEPIAPFIDCFLLGESENMVPAFLDIFVSACSDNTPRKLLKKELATRVKGAYVPDLYEPAYDMNGLFSGITPLYNTIPVRVEVQHIDNLANTTTTTHVLTTDTAFNNTVLIETGRGCHHGCRFCSAGFIYRPSRFYPDSRIIGAMDNAKHLTNKIGLVSATVSDHPGINKICARGIADHLQISFSSLRLDALTDETIQTLVSSSVKTATIAPEAGSQRMRNIINKKIDERQILSSVERLVAHGIMNLKLYFMVGLPFEQEEDVRQIVGLTEKIKERFLEASRKNRKMGTITLSINPFIPKPTTPFQWCAMDTPSVFKKKVAIVKDGLKRVPNLIIHTESPKTATVNAILSRGDRRMSYLLEEAAEKGWSVALKNFKASKPLSHQAADIDDMIYRKIPLDSPLPWDILNTGIKKEFLMKELERAQKEKISPDCPMIECNKCGICRE